MDLPGNFTSSPSNKTLDFSKLKTLSDNKSFISKMTGFALEKYKTLLEKEKMLVNQHFLFFQQCFQISFKSV